jgi:hypothetical protein
MRIDNEQDHVTIFYLFKRALGNFSVNPVGISIPTTSVNQNKVSRIPRGKMLDGVASDTRSIFRYRIISSGEPIYQA